MLGWNVVDLLCDWLLVNNVSFSLCWGEVLGIVGLMGVGCMELVMLIFGCIMGDWKFGEVMIYGKFVDLFIVFKVIKVGFVYVIEDCKLLGLVLDDMICCNILLVNLFGVVFKGVIDW